MTVVSVIAVAGQPDKGNCVWVSYIHSWHMAAHLGVVAYMYCLYCWGW